MANLPHMKGKVKKVLKTTSHSFSLFLALLTLQMVLSVWLVAGGASPEAAPGKVFTSSHFPQMPRPIFSSMDRASVLSLLGIATLAYGMFLWLSLMHIGYDLESKDVPPDETLLIGAVCGFTLGAVSFIVPAAALIGRSGPAGVVLLAPLALVALFFGILFGITLVALGAMVKKYVLS
jgi:hypothetical protein